MAKKAIIDLTTGEINEEINQRAKFLADAMVAERVPFRRQLSRYVCKTVITDESMTHQSHAESCDINNIIRQFDRTGLLPPGRGDRSPVYDDVSHLNQPFSDLVLGSQNVLGQHATNMDEVSRIQADKRKKEEVSAPNSSSPHLISDVLLQPPPEVDK